MIRLSGPFPVTDSLGRTWQFNGIRIFDEGYSIIDVYIDFDAPAEDDTFHEDPIVIRQILSRLRFLGYVGPDFGLGDPGLQDDRLIVLEAPEAFSRFAASEGWRNLADEYADGVDDISAGGDITIDPVSHAMFSALMQRMSGK